MAMVVQLTVIMAKDANDQPAPQQPNAEFIKQADTELAQTESTWTEIDSVISYNADTQTQTEAVVAQPQQNPPEQTTTPSPPTENDNASRSLDNNNLQANNSQVAEIEPLHEGAVSGATNSAKIFSFLAVLLKMVIVAAVAGVGWYVYQQYL